MTKEIKENQELKMPETTKPMTPTNARIRAMAAAMGISSHQLENPIFFQYLNNAYSGGFNQFGSMNPMMPSTQPMQAPTSAPPNVQPQSPQQHHESVSDAPSSAGLESLSNLTQPITTEKKKSGKKKLKEGTAAASFKNLIRQHPELASKLFDDTESGKSKKKKLKEQAWPDYKPGSSIKDYASKVIPRISPGVAGATSAAGTGTGRLAAALRWGKDVVAGKPGGAHSELAPFAKDRGKPDEMGFVRKNTGSTEVGPHKGAFFSRQQASQIGRKHPELLSDPDAAADPPWQAQSYDFKPESGKGKKKVKEDTLIDDVVTLLFERSSQHPFTDAQINKGLGKAISNYDKQQHPYTDAQINKGLGKAISDYDKSPAGVRQSLVDMVPKLPDNAAAIKKTASLAAAPKPVPTAPQSAPAAAPESDSARLKRDLDTMQWKTDTGLKAREKELTPKEAPSSTPQSTGGEYKSQNPVADFKHNVDSMKANKPFPYTQPEGGKKKLKEEKKRKEDAGSPGSNSLTGLGAGSGVFDQGALARAAGRLWDKAKNIPNMSVKAFGSQVGTQDAPTPKAEPAAPPVKKQLATTKPSYRESVEEALVVDKNPDQKTGPRVKGSEPGTKCSNPVPTRDLTDSVNYKKRTEGGEGMDLASMASSFMSGMGGKGGGKGGSPPPETSVIGPKSSAIEGGPSQPPQIPGGASPGTAEGGKKKVKEESMIDKVVLILQERRGYAAFR